MTSLNESIRDICNICTVANLNNPFKEILRLTEENLVECNNALNTIVNIDYVVQDTWSCNPNYTSDLINKIRFAQRRMQCSMDILKYLRIMLLDALSERKTNSDPS